MEKAMIVPENLKRGDLVGLAAPAFAVNDQRVERCVKALEALGLRVKVGSALAKNAPLFGEMEAELAARAKAQALRGAEEAVGADSAATERYGEAQKPDALGVCARVMGDDSAEACSARQDMCGYLESAYLAGSPKSRAEELHELFADEEVKGIFCARGGYGSAQLMPYLDEALIQAHPKVFVGYSDITNLLNTFAQHCGFVCYHAPMVSSNMVNAALDSYSKASMEAALFCAWERLPFENPAEHPMQCFAKGQAQGRLLGGNVTVLARTCGTFYQPKTQGSILFLEDVGESVASLDMYLTQMQNAGMFEGVRGIVLGDFNDCKNSYNEAFDVDSMLRARLAGMGIPVLAHVRSGHEMPMGTLPIGAWCELDAEKKALCFHRAQ